ncbi:Receptor-type tyrosine-protein phosphatase T [Aphelenchoides fujianensis]|nr:Receptor-type tyrosine-protein phosphatase T [Aphelenchoides fujianensis]
MRPAGKNPSKEVISDGAKPKKSGEAAAQRSNPSASGSRSFFGRSLEKIFRRASAPSARSPPALQKKTGTPGAPSKEEVDVGEEPNAAGGRVAPEVERAMNAYVQELAGSGLARLKAEWLEVAAHVPPNTSSTLYEHNMHKNFPGGQPCLDHTRVALTFGVPPATDYLHANWLTTRQCDLRVRLILGQAPMDATADDFWRCVWQEKVRSVVMLCEKYENNTRVCAQYWPMRVGDSKTFGALRVECVGVKTPEDERAFSKLHLVVSHRSERALDTFLYAYKGWPVGGVPETVRSLLRMARAVSDDGQTAFVHGAAGVGRPGVFAALLIAQRAIVQGRAPSVISVVREIREHRLGAISTELQYIFIHRVLLEYVWAKNVQVPTCRKIIAHLDAYALQCAENKNQRVDVPPGHTFKQSAPAAGRRASKEFVAPPAVSPARNAPPPVAPPRGMFGSASPIQRPAPTPSVAPVQPSQPGDQYEVINFGNNPPPPPPR